MAAEPHLLKPFGDQWVGQLLTYTPELLWEAVAVVACAMLAGVLAVRFPGLRRKVAGRFGWLVRRPRLAVLIVGLLPMVIRLFTLPLYPVPNPKIHDEFGHLLIADTFAHGRLANPPHPHWRHFESIYVLHQPAYASYYPIGQGAAMALPMLAGYRPWVGVWLSVGLMCAALTWALQGWLPRNWALVGGLLAVARYSVLGNWMLGYWGGAVGAFGGALALGAFPRLVRGRRPRDAVLFGLGVTLAANTRPYETLLMSIPLGVALLAWFWRANSEDKGIIARRVALPLAAVGVPALLFMGYYNWRVTGDPVQMPYQLHRRIYGTPQSFYWQKPVPPGEFRYKAAEDCYYWQLSHHEVTRWPDQFAKMAASKIKEFWAFYLGPLWSVPLLWLPRQFWRRRFRLLLATGAVVLFGIGCYPFFFPHYAAPILPITLAAVLSGLRVLSLWRPGGRPFGWQLARLLLAAQCLSVGWQVWADYSVMLGLRADGIPHARSPREQVSASLEAMGGYHLVLVRYGKDHWFHWEVVYNSADIDRSRVVWARELGPGRDRELLAYYPERMVWLFEPDARPPRLNRYQPPAPPGAPAR